METPTTERRGKARNPVDRIAFIQLADGNSGTILDVSETGLRFRTVAAVAQNGPVDFWYSMNLSDRVEAHGEVVWCNALRKEGGIAFRKKEERAEKENGNGLNAAEETPRGNAPESSGGRSVMEAIEEMRREALREPAIELQEELEKAVEAAATTRPGAAARPETKPKMREKPQWKIELEEALAQRETQNLHAPKFVPRQAGGEPAVETRNQQTSANAKPESAVPASDGAVTPPVPSALFAEIAARQNERFYVPPEIPELRSKWQFVKGAFVGMVATAALVALAFYFLGLPERKNAEGDLAASETATKTEQPGLLPTTVDAASANAGKNPVTVGTTTASATQPTGMGAAGGALVPPPPATSKSHAPLSLPEPDLNAPQPGAGAATAAPNVAAKGTAQSDGAATKPTAPEPLAATVTKPKYTPKGPRTPSELWDDIVAGNTASEIALAEKYATGDGVEKNCEQARVLLKAAAAKGNALALKTLDEVNATACQ